MKAAYLLLLAIITSLPLATLRAESVVLDSALKPRRGLKLEEVAAVKLEKGALRLVINGNYAAGEVGADIGDKLLRTFTGPDDQEVRFDESKRAILFSFGKSPAPPKSEAGKLTGRTLTGSRRTGQWEFELGGKEAKTPPDPAVVKAVNQFEGYTRALEIFPYLYGTERRKVGEPWKPDLSAVTQALPGVAVEVECKVEELLRQEGIECARIAVLVVAKVDIPKVGSFDANLRGTILRSLDDNLDLDTQLSGTLKFKGFFGKDLNNPTTEARAEAPVSFRRTVKVVKR